MTGFLKTKADNTTAETINNHFASIWLVVVIFVLFFANSSNFSNISFLRLFIDFINRVSWVETTNAISVTYFMSKTKNNEIALFLFHCRKLQNVKIKQKHHSTFISTCDAIKSRCSCIAWLLSIIGLLWFDFFVSIFNFSIKFNSLLVNGAECGGCKHCKNKNNFGTLKHGFAVEMWIVCKMISHANKSNSHTRTTHK